MALRAEKSSKARKSTTNESRLFSGLLICGNCGRRYKHYRTNVKKYDKSVWACPNFYAMGKAICPAQKIPEDILIAKTKEILAVNELDRKILLDRVRQILVPDHNRLQYFLTDGATINAEWQHRSRRDSWTDEMREAARQRAVEQHRKEKP